MPSGRGDGGREGRRKDRREAWREAVVGIGSNLGDRGALVEGAIERVAALEGVCLVAVSEVIETEPVGGPTQGAYLNAAVLIETSLSPRALLDELLAIERMFGRERRERWGPRTLDLDVLWVEGLVVDEPGLTVPHPRLHERTFALVPLVEVAPHAIDPRTGRPMAKRLADLVGGRPEGAGEPGDASERDGASG